MRVIILEDEKSAAENLKHLLGDVDSTIQVECILDTVSSAVDYFKQGSNAELAFFDIHLADGNSFDIFKEVEVKVPVIFTTAYNEYALKAFKVNSIDYLLKPIDEDELREAVEKFKSLNKSTRIPGEFERVIEMLRKETKRYKSTFLVNQRDKLIPIDVSDIAYIQIDSGIVKAYTFKGESYIIDEKLEDIESDLDPAKFFRANRQFIVQRSAVVNLTLYFNGKLILNIHPAPEERIIISKVKAPLIKEWMH